MKLYTITKAELVNQYESWKNTLWADDWRSFSQDIIETPIYGRITEVYDEEGDVDYINEFLYGGRHISEPELDHIVKNVRMTNKVAPTMLNNISIFDEVA